MLRAVVSLSVLLFCCGYSMVCLAQAGSEQLGPAQKEAEPAAPAAPAEPAVIKEPAPEKAVDKESKEPVSDFVEKPEKTALSSPAPPSDLADRYALGLGWWFLRGFGALKIDGYQDEYGTHTVIGSASIFDSPKIITMKIGLNSRLALEPSVTLYYSNETDKELSGDYILKTTRDLSWIRLTPVLSYALFQHEKVNFYLKGGLSFFYSGVKSKLTEETGSTSNERPTSKSTMLGIGLPVGLGIEWWMTRHLAFDISTVSYLLYYARQEDELEGNVEDTDSKVSMALGNFIATLSLMFWF